MKIVFFESSPLWIHGLPGGFKDEGHEIKISGPLTPESIHTILSEFRPDLAFTMGCGQEQMDSKPIWIKTAVRSYDIPLIYWSVEDPAYTRVWSLPFIKKLQPDFVFSICPDIIPVFKKFGIKAAHLDFAYQPDIHFPAVEQKDPEFPIAVVANAYPHIFNKFPQMKYRLETINTLIKPLIRANIPIAFHGKDWDKSNSFLGLDIPSDWLHGYVPYREATKVYHSSEIILGLQNYPYQLSQRTYEILGSGGCLLTQNSPAVNQLFTAGKELITSSSSEQTVERVHYLLANPSVREEMRNKGRLAVQDHTYRHRARYIIDMLVKEHIL
ncbi:glycosyltransferase [Rossellomorea marisflavi]|uniref:CgeB family protein n=1 Tax=Rossellomorea marisflavi TaxID=189381 RepID=UPI0035195B95